MIRISNIKIGAHKEQKKVLEHKKKGYRRR